MKPKTTVARSQTNYNGLSSTRPAILGLAKVLLLGLGQLSYASAKPLSRTAVAPLRTLMGHKAKDDPLADVEDPSMWLNLGFAAMLVLLGGAFAGLTIALMGQDGVYLQVIATSGEGKEQRHAQRVYKLLQKGKHWVLVALLLSNVIVNETLPIVLDRSLGGGWPAVLGSTVLIVIFGEVIPQSVCVRYGLSIGAYMAPFVLGLMWLLAPIAWPVAKLLDKLLGEDHGTVYKKSGLKTLVTLHKTLGTSPGDRLNQDEVTIISAVLDLKDKAVGDIMTPMEDVFTMSADTILDEPTMNIILTAGYSRIPIYEPGNPQNFVGMLLVKILITYDPEDCTKVSEFALATLPETRPETSCLDIVNFFQEGKSHMVLVSDYPGENYGAMGVVTLEDVIEELIGEEIIDESDVYIDVHKAIRRMAPAPKARVQKGHVVGNTENSALPAPEDPLIDLTEDGVEITKALTNGDVKTDVLAVFGTSPKTTFIRRSSAGADGTVIAVRGNVNDMREHLKHLGPSNLASRPKSTRYNTVKIKPPGHGSAVAGYRTDSVRHRDSVIEEHYLDEPVSLEPQASEEQGLLKSAGKDASDEVHALQQGYGTLDRTVPQCAPDAKYDLSNVELSISDSPKLSGSHSNLSSTYPKINRLESQHSDRSSDTLGSLHSVGNSPTSRKKGVARSGSITENIIEAGGVRKVVLETNNSSSDDRDDGPSRQRETRNENNRPRPPPSGLDGQHDVDDEHTERPDMPKGEDVKKKRRRTRKKKGAKAPEDGSAAGSSNP